MANRNNRTRNKFVKHKLNSTLDPVVKYQVEKEQQETVVDPDIEKITGVAIEVVPPVGTTTKFIYSLHWSWGHSRVEDQLHDEVHNPEDFHATKKEIPITATEVFNSKLDGYTTNKRDFVTRQEAAIIAINAKQVDYTYTKETLHSLNSYHLQR